MMTPFFSIITCTKDSAEFLEDTIDSVRSQTFGNYEHIFIDGKSTDSTVNMIKKYETGSPGMRVRLIESDPKGITDAMNMGIRNARGKYIIHMHSDDYFTTADILKRAHDFLISQNEPDWIYGKARHIDEKGREIKIINSQKYIQMVSKNKIRRQLLKYADFICHQAVFIKKEVFEKYGGFDERDANASDYGYWLKIFTKTTWCFFPEIVCNFRFHQNSASTSPLGRESHNFTTFMVQKKYLTGFEFYIVRPVFEVCISVFKTLRKQKMMYGKIRTVQNPAKNQ